MSSKRDNFFASLLCVVGPVVYLTLCIPWVYLPYFTLCIPYFTYTLFYLCIPCLLMYTLCIPYVIYFTYNLLYLVHTLPYIILCIPCLTLSYLKAYQHVSPYHREVGSGGCTPYLRPGGPNGRGWEATTCPLPEKQVMGFTSSCCSCRPLPCPSLHSHTHLPAVSYTHLPAVRSV